MIEIPEAAVLSRQLGEVLACKTIASVQAAHSPHKFAWYYGKPEAYDSLMRGKTVETAAPFGSFVEICAEKMRILFSEGTNLTFLSSKKEIPKKHQLLIGFRDGTYLAATVQMYGGMGCQRAGEIDNPYYLRAKEKPSPNTSGFTFAYFLKLVEDPALESKSVKAVLATEQRIPGLGNGVLQDILYNARVHPARKWRTLDEDALRVLYESIQTTLETMTLEGGRDTERDLFGRPGGYVTLCSKNTVGSPCPRCGKTIEKKAYMGGSVYFCPACQLE